MADLTVSAILTRFRTVAEGSPFFLKPATAPFTHERQPSTALDDVYCLEDAGNAERTPTTNFSEARIDQITLYVARKLKFNLSTELNTLESTLWDLERAIKSDGPNQSYHADLVERGITHPEERDYLVGSLTLAVDYDVSEVWP